MIILSDIKPVRGANMLGTADVDDVSILQTERLFVNRTIILMVTIKPILSGRLVNIYLSLIPRSTT